MRSGDPWARARRATREMEKHLAAIARLADERAVAVRELLDGGLTRAEVARRLGVTPAVVTKILKRPVVVGVVGVGATPGSG
jgi:DNA invertase Pin-like site-specific DNA recombinase